MGNSPQGEYPLKLGNIALLDWLGLRLDEPLPVADTLALGFAEDIDPWEELLEGPGAETGGGVSLP